MADLRNNTENTKSASHGIASETAGIIFVDRLIKDPSGAIPDDKSYTIWQNAWKTFTKMFKGNWAVNATEDVIINAGNEVHITSHNKQETITGGSGHYIKGTKVQVHGEKSQQETDNITQYHAYLQQIDNAAKTAIQNAQPEMTICSNCAQEHLVDDKSDNWAIIFGAIQRVVNILPFLRAPVDAIRWIVNHIYVAIPGVKSNLGLNDGKGCGPGCENGLRQGLANKMKAGEDAAQKEMDNLADAMNKLTIQLSPPSDHADVKKDSYAVIIGDPKHINQNPPYITQTGIHHEYPSNLRPSSQGNKLRMTTEGNCTKVTYHPPQFSPYGNLKVSVANNFKITSGSSGIDVLSIGEIAVKGGSVHINGSQGEVSLTSNNLTTIGGGNVLICADNKSGDTGVHIDSKHTFVKGAFNVSGETAMLGGVTIDGALNVNYINAPSMAIPSTQNGTDAYTTQHANWTYTGAALNATNFALKLTNYALEPSKLMTAVGLLDVSLEMINLVLIDLPIEPIPTGIFMGVCAGFGGGVCAGIIYNFPHNHTRGPESHRHVTDGIAGGYYKEQQGAGHSRTAGNPVPTPLPTDTTWPRPGPYAWGGGCGGGGLYSKVRNQNYGIDSDDAFDGGNYVTTTVVRNPDGSIYPSPDLTYRIVNDIGSNNTIDNNGNVTLTPATTACN